MISIRVSIRLLLRGLLGLALLGSSANALWAGEGSEAAEGAEGAPALHRALNRASDFAPAGVLLDHTHEKGDWTFLYRYQRSEKENLQRGTQSLSLAAVQAIYNTVPLSQSRDTHTFGVMYAPRDRFTVALMLPYIDQSLDQLRGGVLQTDTSAGIGDATFLLLLPFIQRGEEKTQFNISINFPTGDIRADDQNGNRLPYAMQLGTGSWAVEWGITYTGKYRRLSWGAQIGGEYAISENALDYEVYDSYRSSGWLTGEVNDWISLSARLAWVNQANVEGADPALDPAENPMNVPSFQGGNLLGIGAGVNVLLPFAGGQRLSFEAVFPVYQNLDGIQLTSDIHFIAGWQWLF